MRRSCACAAFALAFLGGCSSTSVECAQKLSGAAEWLIDDMRSLIETHFEAVDGADVASDSRPLHDVVSHDNKKWVGAGDVRPRARFINQYGWSA